jgi:secernin
VIACGYEYDKGTSCHRPVTFGCRVIQQGLLDTTIPNTRWSHCCIYYMKRAFFRLYFASAGGAFGYSTFQPFSRFPPTTFRSRERVVIMGCDTFVAFPPLTSNPNLVVFGKNSDRPAGEGQSIRRYPRCTYNLQQDVDKNNDDHNDTTSNNNKPLMVKCTYISIPQVETTFAVLLSQIDWMWGCEMGANEYNVIIGNEAVWTRVPETKEKALLGMDLVRLGLERGKTAREALDVITQLLGQHGQGGPCAENDPSFTYHNSFLIVDCHEAWVLETAGNECWVAQRITQGGRNISNGLTIRTDFDLCSPGIQDYARQHQLWNGKEPFDFAKCFSSGGQIDDSPDSRQACGCALLSKHDKSLNHTGMIAILQDHNGGICMHGGFETTASMVSELRRQENDDDDDGSGSCGTANHWMTGQPYPCRSEFISQYL